MSQHIFNMMRVLSMVPVQPLDNTGDSNAAEASELLSFVPLVGEHSVLEVDACLPVVRPRDEVEHPLSGLRRVVGEFSKVYLYKITKSAIR